MARTIFKHATMLDGDIPAQPGTTVVVEGNRIAEVSTRPVAVQPDDAVYDLRGHTIMPGLGMGHFHAEFHHIDMNLLPHVYNGAERPAGVLMAVAINTSRDDDRVGLHHGRQRGVQQRPRRLPEDVHGRGSHRRAPAPGLQPAPRNDG